MALAITTGKANSPTNKRNDSMITSSMKNDTITVYQIFADLARPLPHVLMA